MKHQFTRYFDTLKEAETQAIEWRYNICKSESKVNMYVFKRLDDLKRIEITPTAKGFKLSVYDVSLTEKQG